MPTKSIEKLDWIILDVAPGVDFRTWRCGHGRDVPIPAGPPTYCMACDRTNLDGLDARLIVSPRDLPPPDPKPEIDLPDPLIDPRTGLRKMTAAEARREAAKDKRAAKASRKKSAAMVKARKAARKAAEKARPKYVAPWKQPA